MKLQMTDTPYLTLTEGRVSFVFSYKKRNDRAMQGIDCMIYYLCSCAYQPGFGSPHMVQRRLLRGRIKQGQRRKLQYWPRWKLLLLKRQWRACVVGSWPWGRLQGRSSRHNRQEPELWVKNYLHLLVVIMKLNNPSAAWGPFLLTWWRHQMKTFSALMAICARNSPVTIPHTKASDAELLCFLWSAPESTVE